MFSLEWRDIDIDAAVLTVRGEAAKSGKARVVPLNAVALDTLLQWNNQAPSDTFVFPGRNGRRMDNINTSWRGLTRDAGLRGLRLHDMRHSFATRLVRGGVDLVVVQRLLGHHSVSMTEKYSHPDEDAKAAAVTVLESQGNILNFPKALEK
jgi:integrase